MIRHEELRCFKVKLILAVAGMYSCHPQSRKNSFISCFCSISNFISCSAWMELVAGARKWEGAAACIGSTSATAARKAGLTRIFYPESPGIEGCVISSQTLPFFSFSKYIMFQTAARSMQYHNPLPSRCVAFLLQNFGTKIGTLCFPCMYLLEHIVLKLDVL